MSIKNGNYKKNFKFSEQQVVSCSTVNYGCKGGWQDEALKYMASAVGVATETSYKYTSGSGGVVSRLFLHCEILKHT